MGLALPFFAVDESPLEHVGLEITLSDDRRLATVCKGLREGRRPFVVSFLTFKPRFTLGQQYQYSILNISIRSSNMSCGLARVPL